MEINKIESIEEYKSFKQFYWRHYFNNDGDFKKVNIIFGENGCGKTSIVNIFKSITNHEEEIFNEIKPKSVNIWINNEKYTYKDGQWNKFLDEGNILYFDNDFIHKNVYQGKIRDETKKGQAQQSAKLIIEFDEKAIKLKEELDRLKEERDEEKKKLDECTTKNKKILEFELTSEEKNLFKIYGDYSNNEIINTIRDLETRIDGLEDEIKKDKENLENLEKISEISKIELLETINGYINIPNYEEYNCVFSCNIEKKVISYLEKELINKIKENKDFFDEGIKLIGENQKVCPFCQSCNEENIKKIINLYNEIYDDTYKKQEREFNIKKKGLISELETARNELNNIDLSNIFLQLKELQEKYNIYNVYSVGDEKQFVKPKFIKLNKFIDELNDTTPSKEEQLDKNKYNEILEEIEQLNKFIHDLNEFINQKNEIIQKFKDENTDKSILIRINENKKENRHIKEKLKFLTSENIKNQKSKDEIIEKRNEMEQKLNEREEKYKLKKREYDDYCRGDIFNNILEKLQIYLSKFNINFKMESNANRRAHEEIPFIFKIYDNEGHERNFKEGLSEGELQALSLSFFFAFLEIQSEKDKKIIIFDDPITSLDNNNLYVLVDLIFEKTQEFSQTFIFTHHQTFFKYLDKKYRDNAVKYYILKNKESLGGSFICRYQKQDLINKLKNIEQSTQYKVKQGLDLTYETIKYGQFLRYEVERLVKDTLLQWNKDNFSEMIEGIKFNKNMDDEDLETLKKIYSFCNWSNTAHVDKDEGTSFEQLKKHVDDFLEIHGKLSRG